MLMKFILVIFLFAVSAYGAPSDGRVYNGSVVESPTTYPFFASVEINTKHVCGGFIYNEYYIVTAASCVYDVSAVNVTVTVGVTSLVFPDPDEQRIGISNILIYSENGVGSYDPVTKLHNLALLRLDRQLRFGNTSKALIYNDAIDGDLTADFIGLGATQEGGLAAANLRVLTNLNRTMDELCRNYGNGSYDFRYMICAGDYDGVRGPCSPLDDGSPLFQLDATEDQVVGSVVMSRAIGIMSHNKGCGPTTGPIAPTIFTRLTAYYAWLRTKAGQQPNYTGPTAAPGGR